MIPYLGCEHARELLDGYLDSELSVPDQIAVESHLRWCRTCAARVEDSKLIGVSIRGGLPVSCPVDEDAHALTSMQSAVLTRVRTEREQSFGVRVREICGDMRLFWPALGATAALLVCFGLAYRVQATTSQQVADLLAAKTPPRIAGVSQTPYAVVMLEPGAVPGSDLNPLRLDDAFLIPQLLDDGLLDSIPEDEAVFTLATVVSRKGRIENYELLRTSPQRSAYHTAAAHNGHVDAVLTAVRQSRFAPAQARGGGAVAVNMVWLIAKTTAVVDRPKPAVRVRSAAPPAPVEVPEAAPLDIITPPSEGSVEVEFESPTA